MPGPPPDPGVSPYLEPLSPCPQPHPASATAATNQHPKAKRAHAAPPTKAANTPAATTDAGNRYAPTSSAHTQPCGAEDRRKIRLWSKDFDHLGTWCFECKGFHKPAGQGV